VVSGGARALLRALMLLPLGVGGCSMVLGIDQAHFDATLEGEAGKSGSAATTSHGGSAAVGGNAGSNNAGSLAVAGSDVDHAEAGAESSSGGSGDDHAQTLCDRYCTAVLASCAGQLEQYSSLNQCLQVCQRLPAGSPNDHDQNTVECRLRQAQFAQSEPLVYCQSSGPLGQDKCGSNCAAYCSLMQLTCTAASTAGNLEPSYYLDEKSCLVACEGLVPGEHDAVSYSSSPKAVPSSYVGNNVFCRSYHVAAALDQGAPDEHCPHARGGDPCTSH
jgi:hypothetical protein